MNFTESLVPKKELVRKGQITLNMAPHGPNWELVGKNLELDGTEATKWELVRKNLELNGTEATKFFELLLTCWLRRR